MAEGELTIPGTQTKIPVWMLGAAALAGLGAWILSRNQPQQSNAQPSTAGLDAAAMAQNFDTLRQELLDYIATNYGTQPGQIGGAVTAPTWPNPLGSQPYPPQNAPNPNPPPVGYPPNPPTDTNPVPPVNPAPPPTPGSPPIPPAQGTPSPIQYPPWQPPTGGPGSGGGARVLHFMPGVKTPPSIYGFPDIAYLTSPANSGDFFTPPIVRATRLQPATGSFIGGVPGLARLPFHISEV